MPMLGKINLPKLLQKKNVCLKKGHSFYTLGKASTLTHTHTQRIVAILYYQFHACTHALCFRFCLLCYKLELVGHCEESNIMRKYIYIYIYINIYISLINTKTGHVRIMNLFPFCYGYWYESITQKNYRTSSGLVDKIIQNRHRKEGWEGVAQLNLI